MYYSLAANRTYDELSIVSEDTINRSASWNQPQITFPGQQLAGKSTHRLGKTARKKSSADMALVAKQFKENNLSNATYKKAHLQFYYFQACII